MSWRELEAMGAISLVGTCAQSSPAAVASNPPPVAPGPSAVWYHVGFDTNSSAIVANGQNVVTDVTAFLQRNPVSIATIVGTTDTVGSNDYNTHFVASTRRRGARRAGSSRHRDGGPGRDALDRREPTKRGQRRMTLRQRRTESST